jgi:lysophospholipase L1-like esterase
MGSFKDIVELSSIFVFCVVLLIVLHKYLQRDNFYTLVISTVLSLLLAEGVCRFKNIGNTETSVWNEDTIKSRELRHVYKPNGRLLYHYPDNPRGYFDKKNEVLGTINSKGFRGLDRDFEKESDKIRLAFLGDSFTLGIGVRDEDTLPANVERELQRNYKNIEVLNFGVSGYNTRDEIRLLKEYVLKFKPDIVVVVLFLNDAGRAGTIRFLSRPMLFAQIRKYSYFINALVGSIEKAFLSKQMIRHYHEGFLETSQGYHSIKAALREGKWLSSKHQFDFIVAVYPVLFKLDERYPFRSIHQNIESFCKSENILFVDLFNAFFGQSDRQMWVHSTDQHPNDLAHRLASIEITDYLIKERLIEKALKSY